MAASLLWLLILNMASCDIGIGAEDKELWWTSRVMNRESWLSRITGEPDEVLRQLQDPNGSVKTQIIFFNNSDTVFGSVAIDTRTPTSIFVHDKTSGRIYNYSGDDGLSLLVARSSQLVEDIAVDWVSQNLYYTDPKVGVCLVSYKTNRHNVIIPKVAALRGVDVDPIAGFLFYADSDTGHIYQATLTGKKHGILGIQTTSPTYLVADSASMTVYWLEGIHTLQSWDYGRNEFKVILSNYLIETGVFSGITVYNNYLYMPQREQSKITVVHTNGSLLLEFQTAASANNPMNGIAMSASERQPPTTSVCSVNNGGCDHICTHMTSRTRRCLCSFGYSLQPDGITCETEMLSENFLLFADVDGIYQMSLTTDVVRAVPLPVTDKGQPDDVTYDPVDKYIYWTESNLDQIWRMNIVTHNAHRFFTLKPGAACQGIIMDPIGRALYFADAGNKFIGRILVTNMHHDVVVRHTADEKPIGIQLDIQRGHIYWSEWGMSPKIEKADIADGRNRQVLVNSQLVKPTSIALDLKASHLYWVDLTLERLERADLTGGNRKLLLATPAGTFGLTLNAEFIYIGANRLVQKIRKSDLSVSNVGPGYFVSLFGLAYYSSSETDTTSMTDVTPTEQVILSVRDDSDTGISQTTILIISTIVGCVIILAVVIIVAVMLVKRRNNRSPTPGETQMSAHSGGAQMLAPPVGAQMTPPSGGAQMMAPPVGAQMMAPFGGAQSMAPIGRAQMKAPPGGIPMNSEDIPDHYMITDRAQHAPGTTSCDNSEDISDHYVTIDRDQHAHGTTSRDNKTNPLFDDYAEINDAELFDLNH